MIIAGLQKCTLVDFPGKIACAVFTQGCNMRCPFCHNRKLWPMECVEPIQEKEFFAFLEKRRGLLDGVVMSGGEPTLHGDLGQILKKIRELGYATKLDTNGTKPDVLADLVDGGLLDFVAMDLKHTLGAYGRACGTAAPIQAIEKSLTVLQCSGLDYELRTTVVPTIHTLEDIASLLPLVKGAPRFTLQVFSPAGAADPNLRTQEPIAAKQLESLRQLFEPAVGKFTIR
jgi:pyruvate formate lyase activating enzyme